MNRWDGRTGAGWTPRSGPGAATTGFSARNRSGNLSAALMSRSMVRSGTPTTMIDRVIWRYHLWRGRRAVRKAVLADQARQLMAEREALKGAPAAIKGLERLLSAAAASPAVRDNPGGPRERRYRR